MTVPAVAADLAGALLAEWKARFGAGSARIDGLRRVGGGASRETWSFDVVGADGSTSRCVLRRDPPGAPPREVGMVAEAALLRVVRAHGVPVPPVLIDGDGRDTLGTPFIVMERIAGETIPRRILRDATLGGARELLTAQCASALARIHAVPLDDLPPLPRGDPLTDYRALLDQSGQPHPAFELALRRLEQIRPVPTRTSLVHGDFRNGNLVVAPDGLAAVLDWELAHIGDPVEDLGWLCVKSWRFGSARRVGGFGDVMALLDAYDRAGGGAVDPSALRWWELMGTLRWGVICILQAQTHLSGTLRSVELAAIGRRVCEVEHDLLLLLDE